MNVTALPGNGERPHRHHRERSDWAVCQIIFSGAMRVDAVQHWSLLLSQLVTPPNGCTGLRAVAVDADSGPLTVHFSGSVTPQVWVGRNSPFSSVERGD